MSILTGQRLKDAIQTGFGLAQIGEFAFMVALIYMTCTGDLSNPMYQIVVGVSLLTTILNPVMLRISDPVGDWCERHLPARVSGWLRRTAPGSRASARRRCRPACSGTCARASCGSA